MALQASPDDVGGSFCQRRVSKGSSSEGSVGEGVLRSDSGLSTVRSLSRCVAVFERSAVRSLRGRWLALFFALCVSHFVSFFFHLFDARGLCGCGCGRRGLELACSRTAYCRDKEALFCFRAQQCVHPHALALRQRQVHDVAWRMA